MARAIIGLEFDKGIFYYKVRESVKGGQTIIRTYVSDNTRPAILRRILNNGDVSKVATKTFCQECDVPTFIYHWFFYPIFYSYGNYNEYPPEYYQMRELLYKTWKDHEDDFYICNDSCVYANNYQDRNVLQEVYRQLCANFANNQYTIDLKTMCKEVQRTAFRQQLNLTVDDYNILLQYIDEDSLPNFTEDIVLVMKTISQLREILGSGTLRNLIYSTIRALRILREKNADYSYSTKGAIQDVIRTIARDYTVLQSDTPNLKKVNELLAHNQTRRDLHFEDEDFIVIVPTTYQELVTEGENQRNCAAHYEYNNYLRHGVRMIVFIRKKNDIEHSYITCDIDRRNLEIKQYLRFANEDVRDMKSLAFQKKYQEYLKTLEPITQDEMQSVYIDDYEIFGRAFYNL